MAVSLFVCLLAIVPLAFSYGISPQRSLSSTCKIDNDCRVINSHCLQGTCECRLGFVKDGSLTKCLKVANGYYDKCEESVQCSSFLGSGGFCNDTQCICAEGYHYRNSRCYESRGLNEACNEDEECFVHTDYQAASCKNGSCQCSEGFYQREYSTCRPKAGKVGDECALDFDCAFHENAKCVSNKCALSANEERSTNRLFPQVYEETGGKSPSKEKIIIGESTCEDNSDCKLIDHSICAVNNTCVCDRGFFHRRIKWNKVDFKDGCAPEISTTCDPNAPISDFQPSYSRCKNNMWSCDIDRVATKDNQLCRKAALDINKQCQYPEMCQLFGPRAECVNQKCKCDETSHWVNDQKFCWKYSKIGDACQNDNDCYSRGFGYDPTCNDQKICVCPENSKASDDGGYCLSNQPELGFYCEKDEECKIKNAGCAENKCACTKPYFELDKKCVAGLNATCVSDDDCKMENTGCFKLSDKSKNKECRCTDNFTAGPDDVCIPKSQYQKECKYDVQCSSAVMNTFCNITTTEEEEEGRCDCKTDHYFNTDACYRKRWLGEECSRQGECFAKSTPSVCRNGICSCEFNFVQEGRECKPKNASPGLFASWLVIAPVAAILTVAAAP